ncbi:MAG TPA: acyl carrier protein [Bauldia sp.]
MDSRTIRKECLDILQRMKELPPADADRLRADEAADLDLINLSFDSLTLLDFCLELEERTGLIIEPADVLAETTLNAVVKLLADRGQAGNR